MICLRDCCPLGCPSPIDRRTNGEPCRAATDTLIVSLRTMSTWLTGKYDSDYPGRFLTSVHRKQHYLD